MPFCIQQNVFFVIIRILTYISNTLFSSLVLLQQNLSYSYKSCLESFLSTYKKRLDYQKMFIVLT